MREICTYGLMRGRAYPTRGVPLYSTLRGGFVMVDPSVLRLRVRLYVGRIDTEIALTEWGQTTLAGEIS